MYRKRFDLVRVSGVGQTAATETAVARGVAMASITKRSNGQWRARYRDVGGHEHARHFARKIDATRWLDSVTTAVETGTYVDPKAGQSTLGEYAPIWLSRQVHLKPSTRSRYTTLVRHHIVPAFGSIPISKIEHSAVAAWIVDLLDTCGVPKVCTPRPRA